MGWWGREGEGRGRMGRREGWGRMGRREGRGMMGWREVRREGWKEGGYEGG